MFASYLYFFLLWLASDEINHFGNGTMRYRHVMMRWRWSCTQIQIQYHVFVVVAFAGGAAGGGAAVVASASVNYKPCQKCQTL